MNSVLTPSSQNNPVKSNTECMVEAVLPPNRPIYRFVKRTFDIATSLITGIVLLVPMLLIGILIRLESPGPAIFKLECFGLQGKPFTINKFRTMGIYAEIDGPQWAKRDGGRCTKFSRILRKTRMYELPQLWNILVGDVSIVGPRPERANFYDLFETYFPEFGSRMAAVPGLTGWAQVNGGYDLRHEEKIACDMEYIRDQSVWMDLKCIVKTVRLVFTHEGAR